MKVSILIPHFKTWRWTAACIHAFKSFPMGVESELILCDNSPGHPSIKAITDTPLAEGVKIVQGQADFPSHGKGYFKAYQAADGDWIFTAETDSFPIAHDWFKPYIDAVTAGHEFIAPPMPMAAGSYGHPAGALVNRTVLDAHQAWRDAQKDWVFIPGGSIPLGLEREGFHAVVHKDLLTEQKHLLPDDCDVWRDMNLWLPDVGPWQEMRSFDDDSFQTYGQRIGIQNWEPKRLRWSHRRIGYEPGQHLWYFAKSHGVNCLEAPVHIEWISGWEGRQAAYSDVFGGFRHVWCGTAAMGDATAPEIRSFKIRQMNDYFAQLPEDLRTHIVALEAANLE